MKVKDKGVLWNFLRKKASEKLQQEQNSLVHLDAEINSVEINLEKMGEMRAIYRDQLNSGSKRMLPANRIRLVQNFIARLDEAAQMAKEQKTKRENDQNSKGQKTKDPKTNIPKGEKARDPKTKRPKGKKTKGRKAKGQKTKRTKRPKATKNKYENRKISNLSIERNEIKKSVFHHYG